ncbi:DUF2158 domain-containing protein [uncultured Paracoccus sp.]|uniref:DUF2158 domain-containing protein n=1 Tax=uncultured Paracoccus sp. TaxID=189685 RepID=UPI002609C942|nr:DUF2158 domain-containing protein [uncultured Paracoccus sp.]
MPGDLVQLKSGGPVMTYGGAGGAFATEARCLWFVGTELKSATFPFGALEKARRAKGNAMPLAV